MQKTPARASLLLALLLAVPYTASAEPLRIYVEAEDCDGLQRYPYHNEDAEGWYAREANVRVYGAPGRSYFAAVHENAARKTMGQQLARPIPPGKYKVSLRIVGPGLTGKDSILEVRVGKTPIRFVWRHRGKRANWLPLQELNLAEAARNVTFTAVQLGGSNHDGLYMPLHNTIWLDTLYLTSDLEEKSPPDLVTERCLRAGIDPASVPERQPHAADDRGPNLPQTPAPVGRVVDDPIILKSFDGRRNLWPNSSFELGMNDGWATQRASHVFTDSDLSAENPFHGRYCFQVTGMRPFSRPYRLEKGGTVTLSLYVRGKNQEITATLRQIPGRGDPGFTRNRTAKYSVALKAQGKAGKEWTRLTVTGDLAAGWYYLAFENDGFLADAVQLEYGDQATNYAPRAEVEGALRTGQVGNIIHESEQDTLDLWLHNSSQTQRDASLRYRIVDVRDRAVAEGTTAPVSVAPGKTVTKPVALLPKLRGIFSVCFAADGREGTDGETVYLVMPRPPAKPTRHQLGGNMNPADKWELAVQSRMGLKWVLTCKSRQFAAAGEGAHPEPEVWKWHDEAAVLPAKYGMMLQPALWPGRVPAFMREEPSRTYRSVRGFHGPRPHALNLDLWKEHVTKVVGHYKKPISWWCIDDESEGAWDPSQFAEYIEATCDVAHKASPGVKVGFSGWVDYHEEVLKFMPVEKLDFFGASSFDLNYEEGRLTRHFARRHGKPYFCYGVGGRPPMHTMYHTLYHFLPPYAKAARMARRLINLLLVQDVTCAGHYAAVFRNYGVHYALNKPLCDYDATPLPWGGTFGCLGTLLADAEPVDHVRLGDTELLAHIFRIGERFGFTTFATNEVHHDLHYRPPDRELKGLTLPCPHGSVEVLDMYWNPHPGARWDGDRITIDLNEEPVFFLAKALGKEEIVEMIRGAKAPPPPCEMSMAFVPSTKQKGSVDVQVMLRNRTQKELRDVSIDMRHSRQPFTVSGDWLLAEPWAKVGRVPVGTEKEVRFATVLDGKAPYEDGRMRANLYAEGGFQVARDDRLWLVPSARTDSPFIDGKLSEWDTRPAAWLAYVWTGMPMGRHQAQLHEKPEHFSYASYRLDARAMFWTGHDEGNLYVAIRLEDDQPLLSVEKGEKLRLVFASRDPAPEIELQPLADGSVHLAAMRTTSEGIRAACTQTTETIHNGADLKPTRINPVLIEVSIPWENIGLVPEPGGVIGFDLYWSDADYEDGKVAEGTLRWAGGSKRTGYILLGSE